jgi:hypothetical protein
MAAPCRNVFKQVLPRLNGGNIMKGFCKYLFDCFEITQNNQIKSLRWWIKGVIVLNLKLFVLSIITFLIYIYIFKNGFIGLILPVILFFFLINYILPVLIWSFLFVIPKKSLKLYRLRKIKISVFLFIFLLTFLFFSYIILGYVL